MRTVARGIPAASEDISLPLVISGSDYLTFLLPHCGPCDNFCYLGHIKKLVDDDDDDDDIHVGVAQRVHKRVKWRTQVFRQLVTASVTAFAVPQIPLKTSVISR